MAHRIQLPVEFRFEVEPIRYAPGAVRLRKWLHGGQNLSWTVSEPREFAGVSCDAFGISRHELPQFVQQQLEKQSQRLGPALKGIDLDGVLCVYPEGCNLKNRPKARAIDPWQLRHDFLHLKHSSEALLSFLNRSGKWSANTRPTLNSRYDTAPGFILEEEIWRQQAFVKAALTKDPSEWLEVHPFRFRPRSKYPHFVHTADDCFGSIIDSITIDFVRRVPFRICKRSDCGTPFAADRKGKQYCSQYCAHLVSVRRNRKELKKRAALEPKD